MKAAAVRPWLSYACEGTPLPPFWPRYIRISDLDRYAFFKVFNLKTLEAKS
jgi:hypothetical protein